MTTSTSYTLPLPRVRLAPVRAAVARRLIHGIVRTVPVRMRYPDGTEVGAGGPGDPVLELVHPDAFYRRLAQDPKIGLGEGYMAGDWRAAEGTDLAELLMPFASRVHGLLPRPLLALRRIVESAQPAELRSTVEGARANIAHHYDLSNDMFAHFLDETMTYSSALFDRAHPVEEQSLAEAQARKIETILDRAGVRAGTRVLEIGTGWGELSLRAAQRGAKVTTITLSAEQAALARQRIDYAGLGDRVDIRLQDYREVTGRFEAVVSVEMIEAVGQEFWPDYFAALDRLVTDNGVVAIQAILMEHERMLATAHSFGWINKYIFPGGLIPSVQAIEETTAAVSTLRVGELHRFGQDYAETLRRWRERFVTEWPQIAELGFDPTFRRMWELYLAYSEAGFATGYLDVGQLTLRRAT